jgi:hypothetical protein
MGAAEGQTPKPTAQQWLPAILLIALFTVAGVFEAVRLTALKGTDIWLHLRTGTWILQNLSVPHNGLFSQYSDSRWIDHGWGFDVLTAAAYKLMGLRALPLLLMLYKAGFAVVLFVLARACRARFWVAVVLSAVAQFLLWSLPFAPVLSSVLLLAGELMILYRAKATGDARELYWLPPLFVVWVNADLHFVFGLIVLALFVAVMALEKSTQPAPANPQRAFPLLRALGISALCLGATLLSPYGWNAYDGASALFGNPALSHYLKQIQSIPFRRPQDFALLLLAMAAFFFLGRQHLRDRLSLVLLLFAAAISFSWEREAWLAAVVSVAAIANALPGGEPQPRPAQDAGRVRLTKLVTAGLAAAVLLVAAFSLVPGDRDALIRMSKTLPVQACDYIRQHKLPPAIFNTYEWGGFIAWYLPEYPVAMDTRTEVYGDDATLLYFKITNGEMPLGAELHFAYAGTTIVPANSPMAAGLSAGPRFTPVYRDDIALVLVRTAVLQGQ